MLILKNIYVCRKSNQKFITPKTDTNTNGTKTKTTSNVMNESDVLVDLEQRIASLEVGATYDASKEAIEKVEMEFLIKLREIRATLLLEQQSCATDGSSASLSSNNKTIMESLQQENDMLKKKTTKLEYRIQHLVANMEEMYERTRKSTEVN
jgi:hypothetical protein